ncbi:MAG: S8 family serine peptidase [Desulfobacterales bacterium]|jgi:subtilisin family serine protease|nr:S8 family serine peptidase [Desulfobacterales bacterium]
MQIRPLRKTSIVLAALLAAAVLFVFPLQANYRQEPSAQAPPAGSYAPGEILVKYKSAGSGSASGPEERPAERATSATQPPAPQEEPSAVVVKLPAGLDVAAALDIYRQDPRVEFAEPNYYRRINRIPNDPFYGQLWGMPKIKAPEAWELNTDCGSVLVAVIDTGADYSHPDLAGSIDVGLGWNFIAGDANPIDRDGHGTHVTGSLAAVGDNAIGVAGICWSARLMVLKAFDDVGVGRVSDIIDAMNYARLGGARIVNASFTGTSFSFAERDAIDLLNAAGILLVASAGNEGEDNDRVPIYPASYPIGNIIAVAALQQDDSLAGYSNYGAASVQVAAPGSLILSTYPLGLDPTGYRTKFGTSMAAPHVSGLAALLWAQSPSLTSSQARARILDGVDRLAGLAGKVFTGGRINAFNSIQGVPAVPSGFAAAGSSLRIDLSWDDNYSDIEGFVLERGGNGAAAFAEIARLDPFTFAYRDSDVAAAATYVYRLRAVKDSNASDPAELTAAAVDRPSPSGGGGGGGGGGCFISCTWRR